MEEFMTSKTALQSNDEPVELTELFIQKKKTVTFSDTVTFQLILCLALSIVFVVINIVNSGLAYDIYTVYIEKYTSDGNITDTFKIILDLLGSIR